METSLHQTLKERYASANSVLEARRGRYRIDVLDGQRLIEIQHSALGAIRDKIRDLLCDEQHEVLVVKPLVAIKRLKFLKRRGGAEVRSRLSPKRARPADVFHELVRFVNVFPHPRLTLEVLLVEVDETRYPGHGRRRRWRRGDQQVEDQKLAAVVGSVLLRRAEDLWLLLGGAAPERFTTAELAKLCGLSRFDAQRAAYCLRHCGAAQVVGKQRNALVYATVKRPALAA